MSAGRTVRIGSDHVIVHENRLTVISRAHMDAWRIRPHRHALIRFDDRSWRVAETAAVPPNATRYTLVPWDLGDHDVVAVTIEYGAEYVAARDHDLVHVKHHRRASGLMRVVTPFTGFLSARIKDRFELTYGIDPVASTKQSVLIEIMVGICALGAMNVSLMTGGAVPMGPFVTVAIIVLPDAAVRWSRVLDEERPPPGFYEWAFRRTGRPSK